MVQFEIVDGQYGKKMILKSQWEDVLLDVFRKEHVEELELISNLGKNADFSFLNDLQNLKSFSIVDLSIDNISQINTLHQLKSLRINTYCDTEINFNNFSHLEECFLIWRKKADSLFDCTTLKRLHIHKYTERDVNDLTRLINLESLTISVAPVESLEGLGALKKLKFLEMARLTKLGSLKGIKSLTSLEELALDSCKKIGSINEIAALNNVQILSLNNLGDIPSLTSLTDLNKLTELYFWESTNIVDGDLSMLERLPMLKKVSFQNRKHYSHKRETISLLGVL